MHAGLVALVDDWTIGLLFFPSFIIFHEPSSLSYHHPFSGLVSLKMVRLQTSDGEFVISVSYRFRLV